MRFRLLVCCAASLLASHSFGMPTAFAQDSHASDGYDIEKTGLIPRYPEALNCSPLTSFYASWDDVDGTKRKEIHSGVDGGRLGDAILSPAPGTIKAVWQANWGWGLEGAILVRHSKEDLALTDGPPYYYSEFDHLRYSDVQTLAEGRPVARGQQLATVFRPGGDEDYLPEVHWEVWELGDDSRTTWGTNKFNGRYWVNEGAHLIDPLYMLGRNVAPRQDGSVALQPYNSQANYAGFKGFTYIFPCPPIAAAEPTPPQP